MIFTRLVRSVLTFIRTHNISLFCTLVFCVLILPINEHKAFSPQTTRDQFLAMYFLKCLFAITFFGMCTFVASFYRKVKQGDTTYRRWLKYSLIYFAIMLIVFLLIYPGHWVWDELNILNSVQHNNFDAWQHYFTDVFYAFSLFLIPTGVSIVLVQIVFASLVVGFVMSNVRELLQRKYLVNWLFIIFILPAVIINNFYPLRLTMYSYVELLLICKLLLLHYRKFQVTNPFTELLALALLITIVSFWRSEGIYYLLILPYLAYRLGIFKRNKGKLGPRPFIYSGAALGIMLFGLVITVVTGDQKYNLPTFINPLSVMLQQPLHGANVKSELATMNKTVNIQMVKAAPDYTETPSFWNGAVRANYKQTFRQFIVAFAQLALQNPGSYLHARYRTFLATNGIQTKKMPIDIGMFSYEKYRMYPEAVRFLDQNSLATPLSPSLSRNVTEFLSFFNSKYQYNFWGHVFWDVIPVILFVVILAIQRLFTRQYFWLFLTILVLLRVILLFFSAPANYFMYYLPVYMSGLFLVGVALLLWIDKKQKT